MNTTPNLPPPPPPPPPASSSPRLVPASILIRYCPIRAPPARALSCVSAATAAVQTGRESERQLRLFCCFKNSHSPPRDRFTPDSLVHNADIVESWRFGEFLWCISEAFVSAVCCFVLVACALRSHEFNLSVFLLQRVHFCCFYLLRVVVH